MAGRLVIAAGTLSAGGLIAGSAGMKWYDGLSGLDLYRRRSELAVAPETNPLIGGFDADGWFESFFGPAVPIGIGIALAAISALVVWRVSPRETLLAGLWLALLSWLAAGVTGASGADGPGIRLWVGASVAAAAILGWALIHSEPTRRSAAAAWFAVLAVLAWLPLGWAVFGLEDYYPFAASSLLLASLLMVGVPAAGAVTAIDVLRSRPIRRPAVGALVLGVFPWGTALLAALA